MNSNTPSCLICHQTNQEIPLLQLLYGEEKYFICPSHLPMLIHQPQRLIGMLPGAENLVGHDHDHEE